jgi:hypothetical protein
VGNRSYGFAAAPGRGVIDSQPIATVKHTIPLAARHGLKASDSHTATDTMERFTVFPETHGLVAIDCGARRAVEHSMALAETGGLAVTANAPLTAAVEHSTIVEMTRGPAATEDAPITATANHSTTFHETHELAVSEDALAAVVNHSMAIAETHRLAASRGHRQRLLSKVLRSFLFLRPCDRL